MKNKNVHIVPANGWGVKREGNKKNTFIALTKSQAINIGRIIAKNEKTELIIHENNETTSNKDNFENDLFPARGRKKQN